MKVFDHFTRKETIEHKIDKLQNNINKLIKELGDRGCTL